MQHYVIDNIDQMTAEQLNHQLGLLPQWRQQQALRYKPFPARVECCMAYRALQHLLSEHYGIHDQQHFSIDTHGKPSLTDHPEIHFNMSHCRHAVICAVSDQPVGVDIECKRRVTDTLMRYTMNDDELSHITSSLAPVLTFLRYWTQKEAILKLLGTGITDDIKDIRARAEADGISTQTFVSDDERYVYSIAQYAR